MNPVAVREPTQPGATSGSAATGDIALRQRGRDLVVALYRALRSLKLYPLENQQVQKALDELTGAAFALLEHNHELHVRIAGELIFVNDLRLRLDLDNYAAFGHVLSTFGECGVGMVHVASSVDRREWQAFILQLLHFTARSSDPNNFFKLQQRLDMDRVAAIVIESPADGDGEQSDEQQKKARAKRTYERSLAVTKDVMNSTRMGRTANVRKVKRAVQSIVDQVLSNEVTLVGLTNLRDYDDYTFTHSVNVCIFTLSIGKRLGLTRHQLFDLGMAALVHDVGKGRVPIEILSKSGKLVGEEWHLMQSHTWLGALSLFKLREYGEVPYRSMIGAYEHHMRIDVAGYPESRRPRELSLFARIIMIADAFDAATSKRSYRSPRSPEEVLREFWQKPDIGFDPVLVKTLINVLGIYPVGSCVILDTHEVAVVHAANSDGTHIDRPLVRIVCRADGSRLDTPPLVDLSTTTAGGSYERTIMKVTDPAKYRIRISDYFV